MKSSVLKKALTGILICVVFLNFYKTAPIYNQPDSPYDARNVFIAGQLMMKGLNPYNDSLLKTEWVKQVAEHRILTEKPPGFPDCGMIYPFWSVPLLTPYFIFSWPVARQFIWILSWVFLFTIVLLSHLIFKNNGLSAGYAFLLILAFKSSLVAVALGQPLLMSMAAIMAAWYFYLKKKDSLAGFLLGIAMIKITVCIPFILLFLVKKKWKLLIFSGIFPLVGALSFYGYTGNLYIPEMIANMSRQLGINYAGSEISAVNTNLTETGILFNYFLGTSHKIFSIFNLIMLATGTIALVFIYLKEKLNEYEFLALLILCNYMFSYHLIYDCMILIFLVPLAGGPLAKANGNKANGNKANGWLWLLLLSPLFIPVNGIFKNTDWIQFHLPLTILILFLYSVYECYRNRTIRNF